MTPNTLKDEGVSLSAYLAHATEQLKAAAIDTPPLDARLLAGHALGLDRAQLLSQSQRLLTEAELTTLDGLLTRRLKHEAVARIIGVREFWSLNFGLNEATLEPRPDSETLVETVLSLSPHKQAPHRILDLGTGSGCLLLSLLHERPNATGLGIDINPRAVEQATKNAVTLGLGERARFCQGNWLTGLSESFDIIISNPPYIPAADIPTLMPEVRDYDPMLALDGGDDGLTPYRFLIPQLARFLNPQGIVAVEVGITQAPYVENLFRQANFINVEIRKDLGGIDRCVTAQKQMP